MSAIDRSTFDLGWTPDADATHGPVNALLRMDNGILDERGVVAVRPGSATVYGPLADLDVHSLFTGVLNGTRYRMTGAGDSVYANGVSIASSLNGSEDVAFGSHLGQILFARGTSKKKYDGTTVRNWGISMTAGAPTIAGVTADTKVFMSCDTGETGTFTVDEGASAFVTGADGTANGARELTPSTTTARSSVTKVFAADQDFSVYASAAAATDDDLITLYVYLVDPAKLQEVTLMIDVNNATNRFQEDYYVYVWRAGEDAPVVPPHARTRPPSAPVTGTAIARTEAQLRSGSNPSPITRFSPVPGWNKLSINRGQLSRIGATSSKGWTTVRAVRVVAKMIAGGTGAVVRIDDVRISGGPMTGTYRWLFVYVRNDGTYTGKSAPSALSAETNLTAQQATVTAPADGSRDSQINEIWVFRFGGSLDAFYRTVVKTGVSGTGSVAITDSLSDRDALILNIKLELDNTVPPDSIIDVDGPYYDRTFVLTSSLLYPSRRLNPDSFSSGQAIRVSGLDETAYWVKKALNGLYIGTSKDIYRLSGTGAELPDDTVDFILEALNIDHPPIGLAVAQEGNLLVYLASDGWRAMGGGGSTPLSGATSLLYRGYTRHGVSPVNLTTGRFRAAITKGQLVAVTPEGSSTTYSQVLYRHVFGRQQWYRHTYGPAHASTTQRWRSILREPDGTLLAGDTSGFVWQLDTGTGDSISAIPVVFWTSEDGDGQPYVPKQASNLSIEANTGGDTLTAAAYLDASSTAAFSTTVDTDAMDITIADATALPVFRRCQWRFTGSVNTLRFAGYRLQYLGLPFAVKAHDSGPMTMGVNELVWIRHIRLKVKAGADLTVTPYFDGKAFTAVTLPIAEADLTTVLEVPVGREYKGRVPRVVITSTAEFHPYWVEFVRRTTGEQARTPAIRIPCGLGGESIA